MKSVRPILTSALLALGLLTAPTAWAHCEVPCGIYGDTLRIDQLYEDVATVEKAMNQIQGLAAKGDALSVNQATRWVAAKEAHAEKIQATVWQYFLTQRVKPAKDEAGQATYVKQLTLLHGMLQAAMKSKQTVDVAHSARLRQLIDAFVGVYFDEAQRAHIRKAHEKKGD